MKSKSRAAASSARPSSRRDGGASSEATDAGNGTIRLNKFLADRGIASRRRCDELIADGKVFVNGDPLTQLGARVDPSVDVVEVDGVILRDDHARKRYYLLNKPAGVVCTNERRENRPRAVDLISDKRKGRIYTVGRLDEGTVGLVILTNDGEFANRVMHPRYGVNKTYRVRLNGRIEDEALQRIREGMWLSDGRTAGARIVVQRRTDRQSTLLVTLGEGRNREVRRVFAKVGYSVKELRRVRIGSLTDRGLKVGHWRPLTRAEVQDLLEGEHEDPTAGRPRGRGRRGRQGSSGGTRPQREPRVGRRGAMRNQPANPARRRGAARP